MRENENNIEVSIVMPCLNEQESVGICVRKAKKALDNLGIKGEVIVVDNGSTDKSVEIAQREGARVVVESEKGYGSAYLKGFKEAKGDIIIMGDADNTYDFSQTGKFILPIKEGYDFVIGSRFQGKIKEGAMPWANRYIGNPILTLLLRFFFKSHLSDVYSGMRAFKNKAYKKMNLISSGMEFALEMIVSVLRLKLKIKEVPIHYFPRKGISKLSPILDTWRSIRFMLLFSPDYLFLIPGLILFILGIVFVFLFLRENIVLFGHRCGVHMMLVASLSTIIGFQIINIGVFAKSYSVAERYINTDRLIIFFTKHFNLEKGIIFGLAFFLIGSAVNIKIFLDWVKADFGSLDRIRLGIFALTFFAIGIQSMVSAFFLSILHLKRLK
ncbi:MAG: glycosyltransferase [Candidatus Omnitrophica bacterium]|nr:glycosyltransferase [Candidatus Omnitrophota bacterium]